MVPVVQRPLNSPPTRRLRAGWPGVLATYIENTLCLPPRRLVVPLCQGDELIRHALCLLSFGPCCLYRLLLDEGGDQVAKEGLSVGRVAAEGPEFHVAACHLCCVLGGIAPSRSLCGLLSSTRNLQLWRELCCVVVGGLFHVELIGRVWIVNGGRTSILTRRVANFLDGAPGAAGDLD